MPNTGDQTGSRARRLRVLLRPRSSAVRALVIACLLPLPVAFAAQPGLVDSLGPSSRELFSPPHDVGLPLGHLEGEMVPARSVDTARDGLGGADATDTGVVTVPSSQERVLAVSLAGEHDIPAAALRAYREAAATLGRTDPACRIDWALLAGIGRVESDHGRYAGTTVHVDGTTSPHIVGLPLDGSPGVAAISDSDGGRLDGDTVWDRAVGPMQFIPTTWSMVAADGDGDGARDPHDLDDAALAAGVYLCAGDGDLSTRSGAESAVFRYNHSDQYVALVLSLATAYRSGVVTLPSAPVDGDGSAPTLDRTPDTPANGEQDATPGDRKDAARKDAARKDPDRKDADPKASSQGATKQQPPEGRPRPDRDPSPPPGTDEDTEARGDRGDSGDSRADDGENGDGGTGDGDEGSEETDPPVTDEPKPETVRLSGAITACGGTFCVSETAEQGEEATWTLDLTDVGDDTAAEDFDKDGGTETVRDELDGVAALEGTVTLDVRKSETGGVATLVKVIGAELPPTEMTGTLAAGDSPEVWTFTETARRQRTWTIDFSQVDDMSTTDVDQDGVWLDEELAAISEQPETTLTVATGDQTAALAVCALDELDLEQLAITATQEPDQ